MKYPFHKKTYFIFTLGCQMNENDSERIATVLENLGFTSAPERGADLIIANLCSVRQRSIDRIWGKLKVWERFKTKPKIFLTGCILAGDRPKLRSRVDGIFDISDLAHLPTLLKKKTPPAGEKNNRSLAYLDIIPKRAKANSAFVPIATGCNNFCSFCAVPYTRGREISRPQKNIINEIKTLLKQGYRYFLLLGQNVNFYNPSPKPSKHYHTTKYRSKGTKIDNTEFIKLLKKIDHLPGKFKFNFMSSNPHDMNSKLIDTYSKLKKWDKVLHIAMQSGDDEILRKMNRKYTSAQFLRLISSLRSHISNLKLSTDIIVGFPGESKKAFENTLKVCKKAKFDKAYIAMYSPRPGTLAAKKYKDDIPHLEKKRRWKILNNLINK